MREVCGYSDFTLRRSLASPAVPVVDAAEEEAVALPACALELGASVAEVRARRFAAPREQRRARLAPLRRLHRAPQYARFDICFEVLLRPGALAKHHVNALSVVAAVQQVRR